MNYQEKLAIEFLKGEITGDGSIIGRMNPYSDPFESLPKAKLRKLAAKLRRRWPLSDEVLLQEIRGLEDA